MPTPQFPAIEDFYASNAPLEQKVATLYDAYIGISRYLTYLLSALDTLNVSRLDAKVIKTGTLDANLVTIHSDLSGGAYIQLDGNGIVINNGVYDTFKADLTGQVTMTGALIQSTPGSYPRFELNSEQGRIKLNFDSENLLNLHTDYFGSPSITFGNEIGVFVMSLTSNDFVFVGSSGIDTNIGAGNNLNLSAGQGYFVNVPSWSKFRNNTTLRTLQQELDSKANAFTGANTGITVAYSVDFASQTVRYAFLTFNNGILTSVVT